MWWNHTELTRNCPVGLLPHAENWSEEVWSSRNTPKCTLGLLPPTSQWFEELAISSEFGVVRPHQTSVMKGEASLQGRFQ